MSKRPNYQVPYMPDGSIPDYPQEYPGTPAERRLTWKDPRSFDATLTLDEMARGRSAAHFLFKSEKGARFTVFMTDLMDMIRDPRWREGRIAARFVPCKRGMNYGVRLVGPSEAA